MTSSQSDLTEAALRRVTVARLIILAAQEMLSNGEAGQELLVERTLEYGSSLDLGKPEVEKILKLPLEEVVKA